jgi:hypothetical protein
MKKVKNLRDLLFVILMFVSISHILFFAELEAKRANKKQLTSPKETLKLLETIKSEAIVFGEGKREIHSFVDPLCSMSRRYMKFLFKNKKRMFKKYKVYLYLYELKRKNSKNIIKNIYDSEEYAGLMLKEIMLNNAKIDLYEIDDDFIEDKITKIEKVAKKIGVFKRPFIIANGRGR